MDVCGFAMFASDLWIDCLGVITVWWGFQGGCGLVLWA